jgi:hypothetical protein
VGAIDSIVTAEAKPKVGRIVLMRHTVCNSDADRGAWSIVDVLPFVG